MVSRYRVCVDGVGFHGAPPQQRRSTQVHLDWWRHTATSVVQRVETNRPTTTVLCAFDTVRWLVMAYRVNCDYYKNIFLLIWRFRRPRTTRSGSNRKQKLLRNSGRVRRQNRGGIGYVCTTPVMAQLSIGRRAML